MIKVAVIGVGSMGKNHARVYTELPEAELVAVADCDPQAGAVIGRRTGARTYTNYKEMLVSEQPQAVSIAVPTALHEEIAAAALQAGAHVLIEKPIAASVEQGRRLIDLAQQVGRQLMVGHIVRFNPAIQALKVRLAAGELGHIFQIVCRRVGPFPAHVKDVGVVTDLAPHDLDLMRYLTGLEPLSIYAQTQQRLHATHEDLLFGLLTFPQGLTGALEINWLTPTKIRELWVLGERGLFRVDDLTQDLYFFENAQAAEIEWHALQTLKGVSEGAMTRYAIQRYEPLKAELQAFLQACQNNTPVPISGADGLAALRLAQALLEASQTRQAVSV
jgi:predicted dehydrogenase